MKIKSITIKNFRSIKEIILEIKKLSDESYTYGLAGINEAGKTSVLKAIALKDKSVSATPSDFVDDNNIEVVYLYETSQIFLDELILNDHIKTLSLNLEGISNLKDLKLIVKVNKSNILSPEIGIEIEGFIDFEHSKNYYSNIKDLIDKHTHEIIFWTSDEKHLISNPINMTNFIADNDISLPLKNCMEIAGINGSQLNQFLSSTAVQKQVTDKLDKKVTEFIKAVWPEHKINVSFVLRNQELEFLIQEEDDLESLSKTTSQRSDGFKQFISFILSVSANDRNEELENIILLIDEPEVHLHPTAQVSLLSDLIKITKNNRNNILFFSTHSTFMLDSQEIERNILITKNGEGTTKEVVPAYSTLSQITYEIFGIATVDYFNQLYGTLHSRYQEEHSSDTIAHQIKNFDQKYIFPEMFKNHTDLKQDRKWLEHENEITFITEIRNNINHFDPKKIKEIDKKELEIAIVYLRELI